MPVQGDDDTIAGTLPGIGAVGEKVVDGERIAGRYQIVRWLGGGGMGRVYEAFDTELEERVALKVLRSGLTDEALERFRREVRLTRRIQHRNVARMFDIGDHAGEKFLTMELIDGEPLTKLLGAALPWTKLRAAALQICAGLAAAHEVGVIHRDLKPDNVLVEVATGRFVITDFGIARSGDDPGVTQIGAVIGTPRYMAPEQLAGGELDARADLFSLGVMLFEMASHTRPWPGENPIAIAVAQATTPVRPLIAPALPPQFLALVMKCLHINPADRPASAAAIADAITNETEIPESQTGRTPKFSFPPPHATPPMGVPTIAHADTTIAVLPVMCAPGDEYLADGLQEDLIDTLSTTPSMRVRPAGLVRGTVDPDVRELGRRLEVDHVASVSLRRTATGIRVSARLISVTDGFQIWAHRAECAESEILAQSEQLARGIATALSTRASSVTRPTDPRAVDLYLRARAELRKFYSPHVRAARDLLADAAVLAPTSGPILGAHAYAAVQAWVMSGEVVELEPARLTLERGLASGHGDAFLASAVFKINHGDSIGGATDLGTALVRAPMSAQAHEFAGKILIELGDIASARHHYTIAIGLDPGRTMLITADLVRLEGLLGNLAEAERLLAILETDRDNTSLAQMVTMHRARLAGWYGEHAQLRTTFTRFTARFGPQAMRLVALITHALDHPGDRGIPGGWDVAMQAYLATPRPRRMQLMTLQILFEATVAIGLDDLALIILDQANRLGLLDIAWLDHCPLFARLRTDAQFLAIRDRVANHTSAVLAALRAVTSV